MRDCTKIQAWVAADDLAVAVYSLTERYPSEEKYGITSQLRRAAVSVAANIAEGSARQGAKEWLHFLHIARGSLAETHYLLHLSARLGYSRVDSHADVAALAVQTFRILHGLIKSVEREARLKT